MTERKIIRLLISQVRHFNTFTIIKYLNGSIWSTDICVIWACKVMALQIDILWDIKRAEGKLSLATHLIRNVAANSNFEVLRSTKELTLIDAISSTCSATSRDHGDSCTDCCQKSCEELGFFSYTYSHFFNYRGLYSNSTIIILFDA